jgi:DNA gyrase/topoisomerase IV subunit A
MDPVDQAHQIEMAKQRLEILDAVARAQDRYAEVSAVIAASADKYEARAAVGRLLGVREDMAGRAVTELIWFRLTAADRRQVREDRDEVIAELRAAGVEPTWSSRP